MIFENPVCTNAHASQTPVSRKENVVSVHEVPAARNFGGKHYSIARTGTMFADRHPTLCAKPQRLLIWEAGGVRARGCHVRAITLWNKPAAGAFVGQDGGGSRTCASRQALSVCCHRRAVAVGRARCRDGANRRIDTTAGAGQARHAPRRRAAPLCQGNRL